MGGDYDSLLSKGGTLTGMPPTSWRSATWYFPCGDKLAMSGTRSPILLKSFMSSSTSALERSRFEGGETAKSNPTL